jgi:hypothetical protein
LPERLAPLLALAAVAATLAILLSRPDDHALLRGVESGGAWAEHSARILTIRMWGSEVPALELFAKQTDTLYPPFLHWTMGAVGALIGHGEVEIARAMTLWLVLLAFAAGLVAWRLSGWGSVGWLVVATTVCVSAIASLRLVYYYDLPMTALLWLGLAWMLLVRRRSPELAGVGGGLLWFLATITKWTALPFGFAMLVGALLVHCPQEEWSRREALRRARAGVATGGCFGLLLWTWTSWTTISWQAANSMMMGDPGTSGVVGRIVQMMDSLEPLSIARLAHYPADLGVLIFSPLIAVLVLGLGCVWLHRDRRGAPLLGLTVLGQWAVLLWLVPTQKGRFLITLAPALVIAAVLGLSGLPRRARVVVAVLWVTCSLLVVADVQHGTPNGLNQRWSLGPRPYVYRTGRGLSIDSSEANTGWRRADMLGTPFAPERERLWERVRACEGEVLVVEMGVLRDSADRTWWEYRNDLAGIRRGRRFVEIIEMRSYVPDDRDAVVVTRETMSGRQLCGAR